MARKYFGTDGVRGLVGEAPITPDFVMRLGFASGQVLVQHENLPHGEHPAVLIGKDPYLRLHARSRTGGRFLGCCVDVILAGPIPT